MKDTVGFPIRLWGSKSAAKLWLPARKVSEDGPIEWRPAKWPEALADVANAQNDYCRCNVTLRWTSLQMLSVSNIVSAVHQRPRAHESFRSLLPIRVSAKNRTRFRFLPCREWGFSKITTTSVVAALQTDKIGLRDGLNSRGACRHDILPPTVEMDLRTISLSVSCSDSLRFAVYKKSFPMSQPNSGKYEDRFAEDDSLQVGGSRAFFLGGTTNVGKDSFGY